MTNTTETTPLDPRIQPLSDRQMNSLLAPLNQNRLSTRRQGSKTLSYLESWDVRRALILVFGFGGFDAVTSEARVINTEAVTNSFNKPAIRITVMVKMELYIHQLGARYAEYAASSQTGQDPGDVLDFAIKTAESDALKRCAMNLGTQFGLSLYDDGNTKDVVKKVLAPHQEWPRATDSPAPGGPAAQMFPEPAEGVTPEQHNKNLDLVNQAFGMREQQQLGGDPKGAANLEDAVRIDPLTPDGADTPMALDPQMASAG